MKKTYSYRLHRYTYTYLLYAGIHLHNVELWTLVWIIFGTFFFLTIIIHCDLPETERKTWHSLDLPSVFLYYIIIHIFIIIHVYFCMYIQILLRVRNFLTFWFFFSSSEYCFGCHAFRVVHRHREAGTCFFLLHFFHTSQIFLRFYFCHSSCSLFGLIIINHSLLIDDLLLCFNRDTLHYTDYGENTQSSMSWEKLFFILRPSLCPVSTLVAQPIDHRKKK